MKINVYKAVCVDKRGTMWSLMKSSKGFYKRKDSLFYKALRYKPFEKTSFSKDECPKATFHFLFAFGNLKAAKDFICFTKTKKRIEIWEAEAEIDDSCEMPTMHEQYIRYTAPLDTVFCKSITLIKKVFSHG